jgi:uncharacterized phage-associated protein
MENWFNDKKTAQIAAFFCERSGAQIHVLKLVKLIYLADRKSLGDTGYSMTNDDHYSLPHGPVNSITRDLIQGVKDSEDWSGLIAARAGNEIGLSKAFNNIDDTDELSDNEVVMMESIWDEFGQMDRFELVEYTHKNCPEWEDPHGGATLIPVSRILKFLGVEKSEELEKRSACQRQFISTMNGLDEKIAF